MGRTPWYYNKGLWSPEEDIILVEYIHQHGIASWSSLAKNSGLQRCGKSCRLRWVNYLRPDIKLGCFTPQEKKRVMELQAILGNRWSVIATHLPGRTDNEIKNVWNVHLKKLVTIGLDPQTHELNNTPDGPSSKFPTSYFKSHMGRWENAKLETEVCISSGSDYFLQLWNSDVGESFRKMEKKENPQNSIACQSPAPPSMCHMTQWDNVRLEAESRLLSGSRIYKPNASSSDYFLQLWNSEVGESFRKVKTNEIAENGRSLVPRASFSTFASNYAHTVDTPPSMCHVVQWESSKLEAESRLLSGSQIYKPNASSSDYFLQLWNSEVGESFRKVKINEISESARLEAESRLLSRSQIYKPNPSSSDYFLQLWNSEVGESFRKVKINENPENGRSLVPRASFSTKFALNAAHTVDTCQASKPASNQGEEIAMNEDFNTICVQHARSYSGCSTMVDDSSKSFVQLLLDCHANNDMSLSKSQIVVQHARSNSCCSNVVDDDSSVSFLQLLFGPPS